MKQGWKVTIERISPLSLMLWRKGHPLGLMWSEYRREQLTGPRYWFKSADQRIEIGVKALLALAARVEAAVAAQQAEQQRLKDLCTKLADGDAQ